MTLLILSHGHEQIEQTQEPLPPLKERVRDVTGETVRRIGRFIQLSLIGAGHCLHGQTAPAETAFYRASGRGDLEVTLDVLTQMIVDGQPPKPLSFINTVSNSACYYVARHFGLHGRSVCVTRRHAPLESALTLAALDLDAGQVPMALVGVVDICTSPLVDHRKRLALPANAPVGEGSHWFLLAASSALVHAQTEALARLDAVIYLPDHAALTRWLGSHTDAFQSGVLMCGQHTPHTTATTLRQCTGLPHWTPPVTPPWYDCHAGHHLGQFLQHAPARTLLHIDCDALGGFNLMQVTLLC